MQVKSRLYVVNLFVRRLTASHLDPWVDVVRAEVHLQPMRVRVVLLVADGQGVEVIRDWETGNDGCRAGA